MKNSTKSITKNLIISIVLFLVLAAVLSAYTLTEEKPKEVQVSARIQQINDGKVKSVEIDGDKLAVELGDGTKEATRKEPGESFTTLLSNYKVDPAKMDVLTISIK